MDNPHQKALVELAQAIARDERHWTTVDVADRADSASTLADAVLEFFDSETDLCPDDCEECLDQVENLGGPGYA